MLEKLTHIAEQAATTVSRRQFLGRFGRGAAAAAALGAMIVLPNDVVAGRGCPPGYKPCRTRLGWDCCRTVPRGR